MNIKKFVGFMALTLFAMTAMNATAGNIDANTARAAANSYFKQHMSSTGMLKAPAMSDIKLVHAEPSNVNAQANTYYAFNVTGGGFVIIAGEDRATQVLGYSDKGQLDFNNLPAGLKDMLNSYKKEIEFIQSDNKGDLIAAPKPQATGNVGPLLTTTWGQEMPYYLQCPIQNGEYCVVGCVATALAQVMYYWKYPASCSALSSYNDYWGYGRVPSLPGANFEYDKMLDTYCVWDWDNSQLIQLSYTDEQAQAVATLSRYCGQAVYMSYSPEGSGAYTGDQYDALVNTFGYKNTAQYIQKSRYSNAQWQQLLNAEFDAGRPVLYAADDPNEGGHAFVLDGYNSDGLYHINWGWYATGDGYFAISAFNVYHREGITLHFNSGHEMIIGIEPPAYATVNAGALNASNDLTALGSSLACQATNVNISTNYSSINLVFALTDASGNIVARGDASNVKMSTFTNGSTVNGAMTLPVGLAAGDYNLKLYYYTTSANNLTAVNATGKMLHVCGHLAKYDAAFLPSDIATTVNWLLNGTNSIVVPADISALINKLME